LKYNINVLQLLAGHTALSPSPVTSGSGSESKSNARL